MTFDEFQKAVHRWMSQCFGETTTRDGAERFHRFFEEAAELVQSVGMPKEDAHVLIEYVYGRPAGEPLQEVGGVMVSLAGLCTANHLLMEEGAWGGIEDIWRRFDKIREKRKTKPKFGPLPGPSEQAGLSESAQA